MTTASMLLVRPVERADIAALVTLAACVIAGVHTLPKTHAAMTDSVGRSIASFAAEVKVPADETYTFVLEDSHSGALFGTAALAATAGTNGSLQVAPGDTVHCVKL